MEKAKAAVNAVKVAQALDAIASMLDATATDGKAAAAAAGSEAAGKATKSVDTLTNLSAYLTLYRWACVLVCLAVCCICIRVFDSSSIVYKWQAVCQARNVS